MCWRKCCNNASNTKGSCQDHNTRQDIRRHRRLSNAPTCWPQTLCCRRCPHEQGIVSQSFRATRCPWSCRLTPPHLLPPYPCHPTRPALLLQRNVYLNSLLSLKTCVPT